MVYWAPSTRIRFCLKTEIFFSGLAHKKCSFLKSLSLSFTCGWTKTQVFEYDDIIRHLPKHYACSVRDDIVFPLFSVFAWTAENDSNTLRVDAYFFLKTEEKISVFKNIRIHLDGALNSPLVDAWRKKLLPVTVLDASIVPDCLCSTRLPSYQYRKSLPVLDTCITFKTVQYIEYKINPIKEFTLNNNSKLCFH